MKDQFVLPDRWDVLTEAETLKFTAELNREMCETHMLYGSAVKAIARFEKRDDFLFCDSDVESACYVVHLSWTEETKPDFPWTTKFDSIDDFVSNWQRIWD